MKTQTFDIRVALLGYVSAGKSTVLNAMLQKKCSQVAMRRTTAGVNLFRLYSKESKGMEGSTAKEQDMDWNPEPDTMHTPEQALRQITIDNEKLRQMNSVHETTFNIELDEPLCDMRKDTALVLIDIPGLNEAGSKDMYRDYVVEKWDTFDCVVVVMDVFQGVNTEEQVQLLEIVNESVKESKDIPIIVLCNKVDDPENKEVQELVKEIKQKVDSIFEGSPVDFFAISAENAFVYRTASRLSLDDFKSLDEALIHKIGSEEVGKSKWRRLSMDDRYRTA
jgi:small GTP-binding protein